MAWSRSSWPCATVVVLGGLLRGLRLPGLLQRRRARVLAARGTGHHHEPAVAASGRPADVRDLRDHRHGAGTRAPGQPRRAHQAAQPQVPPRAPRSRPSTTRPGVRRAVRARPRPVQGGQRHPRPPHRRPAAAEVAERLRDALRPDDVVARLGGDEFAVLLPRCRRRGRARGGRAHPGRAGRAVRARRHALELEASIGIALAPTHGNDVERRCSAAPTSRCTSPRRERSGVETYSRRPRPSLAGRLGAARRPARGDRRRRARAALPAARSTLSTGAITGVEALVRWRHPHARPRAPDEFVPLAESSGLMHPLTALVVDTALAQAAELVGPRAARCPSRSTSRRATCTTPALAAHGRRGPGPPRPARGGHPPRAHRGAS